MSTKAMLLIAAALAAAPLPPCSASTSVPGQEPALAATAGRPRAVARLNRWTFRGNVLAGDRADQWLVLFCVDWASICEEVASEYAILAAEHSASLNQRSVFRDVVRFASVDCAVDKVLCNEQLVDDYPTVVRYEGGKRVAAKAGRRGSLARWLKKELPSQDLVSASSAKPLLTDEEKALALRVLVSFVAVLAFFLWAVSQGADLWLSFTTARDERLGKKAVEQPHEAPRALPEGAQLVTAAVVAAPPAAAGGRAASRIPQEWARERGSLVL